MPPVVGGTVSGLSVGGGPVWSPDGHYLAYGAAVDQQSTVKVVGWRHEPGVGHHDVAAQLTQMTLPVDADPLYHELGEWVWESTADSDILHGRLLFNPTAGTPLRNMWLPIQRLADGTIELPQNMFQLTPPNDMAPITPS